MMKPGGYQKLFIGDTGEGMDRLLLEKAFEPYFTTKEKGSGTGLGLALVDGIVAEHDAFLQIDTAPGKGTGITIYFPLYNQPDFRKDAERLDKTQLNGNETIMIVEDEASIREIYKNLLEKYGYTVRLFESGNMALETFKMQADYYDLVITDMDMPGITGGELASEITSIKQDIPVVLSSGFDHGFCEEAGNLDGIKGFLMKPVPESKLLRTVRCLLDGIDIPLPEGLQKETITSV